MANSYLLKVKVAFILLIFFVLSAASLNYLQSLKINSEKLPLGLESEKRYQGWIRRWKDKFPQIESDTFKKIDDGEIISSTNPRYSFSETDWDDVKTTIETAKKNKYNVIAPDKNQYLNFRSYFSDTKEASSSYVYYFGVRENKTISGPIYECKKTNCYFDRPFFLNPDLFYMAEVEEKLYPDAPNRCKNEGICSYELLMHEFNLKKNKRTTFRSSQLLTDFKKIQSTLDDL